MYFTASITPFCRAHLDEELFIAYTSPLLASDPRRIQTGCRNRALPVDYGDVCINYDKAYFAQHDLAIPASLQDLVSPEYGKQADGKGLLVVENPATSSPGLAFLLTTIALYGEEGYLQFWQALEGQRRCGGQ